MTKKGRTMLPKPQVKKDLIVARDRSEADYGTHNKLRIDAANEAAQAWVHENCKEFGRLLGGTKYCRTFGLYVRPFYDINEVVAYIDSYNDRDKTCLYASELWKRCTLACPLCSGMNGVSMYRCLLCE